MRFTVVPGTKTPIEQTLVVVVVEFLLLAQEPPSDGELVDMKSQVVSASSGDPQPRIYRFVPIGMANSS